MQEKIRGIVLRTVKYGDKSLIVDLFTENHGRMSFVTTISRTKRTVCSVSYWQPLSMVEFNAEIRSGNKLPKPTDVNAYYSYGDIPFSPVKSTLVLFLAEFLSSALREEKENHPLYIYIESSLQWLDMVHGSATLANFHLVFLMQLSRFVGIYPNMEDSGNYFDLLSASHCWGQPPHSHFLKPEEAKFLPRLFRMNYNNMCHFRFSRSERMRILNVLNEYYRLHVPGFPQLKSLEVLHELYS